MLWVAALVLLLVVVPIVVVLLKGVLRRGQRASCPPSQGIAAVAAAGLGGPRRGAAAAHHAGADRADRRRARRLRRLARHDPGRRGAGSMSAPRRRLPDRGPADRARARLLPRVHDPRAAQDHRGARRGDHPRRRDRREERAGQRRRARDQRAARRGRGAAGGAAGQEGRDDRRGRARRGPVPGRRRGRASAPSRRAREVDAPRIGEVYTKGTLTLARLGREAPIAALSPQGAVLRNVEGGSLAARLLYPSVRHEAPGEAARVAGDRDRRARSSTSAARTSERRASGCPPRVLIGEDHRCRPRRHSSTSVRPASRARSRRSSGSAPRRGSSPAGTACCR